MPHFPTLLSPKLYMSTRSVATESMGTPWHALPIDEVLEALSTSVEGLTQEEARERLEKYGPNELEERVRRGVLSVFIEQFKSVLVILLIFAAAFSLLIREYIDAAAIGAILVINAVLGTVQEYRAEKSLEALKRLAAPKATVLRDGLPLKIAARELVPGDVILLQAGDRVPADARLIESANLQVDESVLTGESIPVDKEAELVLPEDTPLPDRKNMVYSSSIVTYGRAKAVVVATGMSTEIGRIATLVQREEKEETPLQKRLDSFGKKLGVFILLLAALVSLEGMIEFGGLHSLEVAEEVILTGISLAVSAVPEGLPAVVTVALAVGVQRMASRNAIVRRLAAVETLGSATVIATDKTGTITMNEMAVRELWVAGESHNVSSSIEFADEALINVKDPLSLMLTGFVLCNDSRVEVRSGKEVRIGDPTELALLLAAKDAGLQPEEIRAKVPRIAEVPFESARKRMTTFHRFEGRVLAFMKGAPEVVIPLCSSVMWSGGEIKELTEDLRSELDKVTRDMASRALRVLALAFKVVPEGEELNESQESKMVLLGLVGMMDPPRPEVPEAVARAKKAGIRVVMITGDHALTAAAVAREVGIDDSGVVITGWELDKMSDQELEEVVERVSVFARVSPEHKLRILNALKARGHIVAMTGDGVNDAPAVKRADIGVAMGIRGSDVTREAADMVLTDDNFATIVNAIEEGRRIYDNIRKFIRLLLSANWDEILVVSLAAFLDLPLPFLPLQILWLNLLTDGLPAMALGLDPPDEDVMDRPPRDPQEEIYHGMLRFILVAAIVAAAASLVPFAAELRVTGDVARARTLAFTIAVVFELFLALNCRSPKKYVYASWKALTANKALILAILTSFALQLTVIYVPHLRIVFKTAPLTLEDWGLVLIGASGGIILYPGLLERE